MLGGSFAISIIVYNRGNRRDYDRWANEYGATGWSYQEVLPYFLRSENNTDPDIVAANPQIHSTRGPVEVCRPPNPDPIYERFYQAGQKLGWPVADFSNSENQYGITHVKQPHYIYAL